MTPNYGYDPTDPQPRQPQQGDQSPQSHTQQGAQTPQSHTQQGAQTPQSHTQQAPANRPPAQPPATQQRSQPANPPSGRQQSPQQSGAPQQRPARGAPERPHHQSGSPQGQPTGQGRQQGTPPQSGQQPQFSGSQGSPAGSGASQWQAPQTPAHGAGAAGPRPSPQRPRAGGANARRPSVLGPTSVDEVVTEAVVTTDPDTPIRTVVAQMAENDVGSVVVVEDGEPVGVVTDRTIALALEDAPDATQRTVADLADRDVVTADQSTSVTGVLQLMSDEGIRRVPVVDDDGSIEGIVSIDDVLVLLAEEFGQVATVIRSQSPDL